MGLPEVTEKGETRKTRGEFSPRKLFGQLVGSLGGLFMTVAVGSSFRSGESGRLKYGAAVSLALFGIFLVLCAALLLKSPIFENKPALWFPAVSGFVCSCSVLVFTAAMLVKVRIQHSEAMDPGDYILLCSALSGVVSAIVCIITGCSVLFAKQPAQPKDSAVDAETNR
jgi:drug/metabolite transporter (DMT)-like permease